MGTLGDCFPQSRQLPFEQSVGSTEFDAKPASAGFVVSGQEITLDLRGSSIVLRLTNSIS